MNQGGDNGIDEFDSVYYTAGLSAKYGTGSPVTKVSIGGSYQYIYYADPAPGFKDSYHNSRVNLNVSHKASRRLTLGLNSYVSYEIEPDYAIGASTTRRGDQYLYGYLNLSASMAWSRRVSSVHNYTLTGVSYDDVSREDRLVHTFSNQLRYAVSPRTSANGEYRYAFSDYDFGTSDYDAHYFLVGADHSFSRLLAGNIAVGVEHREYDAGHDRTNPYLEAALRYQAGEDTSLRWYHRYGMEDNEVGNYTDRDSYRTGLSANHRLTPRLMVNGALQYVFDSFGGGVAPDFDDNVFALSTGLGYQVYRNTQISASYNYTNFASDRQFREFDRHRVTLGLRATF
jgi:hypothetical protein